MPTPIREALTQPFSLDCWRALLKTIFPIGVQFDRVPKAHKVPSERILACREFGRVQLADDRGLVLLEIQVADNVALLRNRVELRNLVSNFIDQDRSHGVLALIHSGKPEYRLTFSARLSGYDSETESFTQTETAARRFTYVLGPGETRRTAGDRLEVLAVKGNKATVEDVIKAFDVEPVSKEFFVRYKEHYAAFCAHLLSNDTPTRIFGITLNALDGKELDHALKPVRDYVKKLLGRLVFLSFLQKKGWLGCPSGSAWGTGHADFLQQLFDSTPADEREHFHSSRLLPLFFDTLNNSNRNDDLFSITGTRVPYLNGGLFERDFEGVEEIEFPVDLFARLFEFLGQYHFTIDENDPEDHEIGIDPEMLGHIFENLLEDNKDKGAYYTPKSVVQYMCQQSLIHSLSGHFVGDEAANSEIEKLIRSKEPVNPRGKSWLPRNAEKISGLLDDLRICDPAIGSGAFPIGLLQEIYWTKLTLNPSANRSKTKRAIIQNSIHGVDLDAGAVEIARLRFWLSLIVDEDEPLPLPNLDYQIMQGNSLLESFDGIDLSKLSQPGGGGVQLLGTPQTELVLDAGQSELSISREAQTDITQLQQDYFACHDKTAKEKLRNEIDATVLRSIDAEINRRIETLNEAIQDLDRTINRNKRISKGGYEPTKAEIKNREAWDSERTDLKAKSIRLHQLLADHRVERPFFLWNLWFKDVLSKPPVGRGGFDIVIANPPYVRQESIKDLKPFLISEPYECFTGTADLLVYFYECSVKKLKPGGVITFITSNKFYRAGYGESLRAFLARELTLHRLIDFGDAPVFEAIAYASILEGIKTAPTQKSASLTYTWEKGQPFDAISSIVETRGQLVQQCELKQDGWRLESPAVLRLLAKLRANGIQLGEYTKGRFYRGILTGLNEAFVVSRETRDRLIAEHPSSAEVIKPYLRGRDVKRWKTTSPDLWLIFTRRGIDISKYPAVLRYLQGFRDALTPGAPGGRKAGSYQWFEVQDNIAYWNEFTTPKLIVPAISARPNVALDREGFFSNNKTSIFVCDDAEYVSAIVNSSVAFWFTQQVFATKQGGFYDFEPRYSSQWPIPAASSVQQTELADLVARILEAKRSDNEDAVETLESEINTRVYRLYGLTRDEIQLIEGHH